MTEVKIIGHIRDLKLNIFIRCAVDHEYNSLVLEGEPTAEELEIAWLRILSQYHEASGSDRAGRYVETVKWMDYYALRLQTVANNIAVLRLAMATLGHLPEQAGAVLDELRAEGYEFEYSEETIEADLRMIETLEKNIVVRMNKLKVEMLGMKGSDEAMTDAGFLESLFNINKHEGTVYRANDLTTLEYCLLLKRIQKQNEIIEIKQLYGSN